MAGVVGGTNGRGGGGGVAAAAGHKQHWARGCIGAVGDVGHSGNTQALPLYQTDSDDYPPISSCRHEVGVKGREWLHIVTVKGAWLRSHLLEFACPPFARAVTGRLDAPYLAVSAHLSSRRRHAIANSCARTTMVAYTGSCARKGG